MCDIHFMKRVMMIDKKIKILSLFLFSAYMINAEYSDIFCDNFGPCSIEIRAGVDPIVFSDKRDTFEIVELVNEKEGRLDKLYSGFKFSDIFKTPWIIAGQLNWDINNCHSAFLECNYAHASGENITRDVMLRNADGEVDFKDSLAFGNFGMFGAYIGYRNYIDIFDCAALYLGSKVGLGHYKEICTTIQNPENPSLFSVSGVAYEKQTVVSGGLQIGLDCSFFDCASFMVQVEVIGSGSLSNSIDRLVLTPDDTVGGSNIIMGKTGTLVSFPITFGFNYSW